MDNPQFKPGDRVRYTGKRFGYADSRHIGAIGTVTEQNLPNNVRVKWDDPDARPPVGVYPQNIELIEGDLPADLREALRLLRQHGEVTFRRNFEPIEVRLNGTYSAIVHRDKVQVGCQLITFTAVEEVYAAVQTAKAFNT